MGEGGFAQPGRAEQQGVVECLTAFFRRLDKDFQLFFGLVLADVVGKEFGTQGAFDLFFLRRERLRGNDAFGRGGGEIVSVQHGGRAKKAKRV